MSSTLIARNRFGLGARPGERRLDDPRGWLRAQCAGDPPPLAAAASLTAVGTALRDFLTAARSNNQEGVRAAGRAVAELAAREGAAALTARVGSDRPFAERWIAFWSNHLCVSSAGKLPVAALAGAYERDVIRAHAFAPFERMLLASARHPAMLVYLDNAQSIGPRSRAARRAGRGLNENYARELLELHTLGVDGGYAQADVEQLARILTGWTADGLRRGSGGAPAFRFAPALHEPGDKVVLGVRYAEAGEEEGRRVIRALARHPRTATHLAGKLARHFIADEPPAAAVERLAAAWREGEGDLRVVAHALVELDAAWEPAHRKFRTPHDWLVAALRALDRREVTVEALPLLRQLRQPLWAPPAPAGFGDRLADWADPDALMNRAELARSLAARLTRAGGAPPPAALAALLPEAPDDPLRALLGDADIPAAERLALALAGPAFQWR